MPISYLVASGSGSDSRSSSGRSTSIGGADVALRGVAEVLRITIRFNGVESTDSSALSTSTEQSERTELSFQSLRNGGAKFDDSPASGWVARIARASEYAVARADSKRSRVGSNLAHCDRRDVGAGWREVDNG